MNALAGWITLVLLILLTIVFWFVIARSQTTEDYAEVQGKAGRLRSPWFWILVVFGVFITFATLRPFPITAQAASQDAGIRIDAIGHQWRWTLSQNTVPAGEPVVFHVTASDVNHGFAIYDENSTLLTQTQAMPGYVNKLRYTFNEPGTYRVLCLEYCGVAHHAMVTEIQVLAP